MVASRPLPARWRCCSRAWCWRAAIYRLLPGLVLAARRQAQQRRALPAELAAAVHAAHWLQLAGQPALQWALLQWLAPQAHRLPHDLRGWAHGMRAAATPPTADTTAGATADAAWAALPRAAA